MNVCFRFHGHKKGHVIDVFRLMGKHRGNPLAGLAVLLEIKGAFEMAPGFPVKPSGVLSGPVFCPWSLASSGFKSKVSIGLAPPFMKSWMTRLTLAG
jgi:hypothetical protein